MGEAEAASRKNRKPGPGVERLANAARLGALSKELGVEIRRHRDPGQVGGNMDFGTDGKKNRSDQDETIVVKRGF